GGQGKGAEGRCRGPALDPLELARVPVQPLVETFDVSKNLTAETQRKAAESAEGSPFLRLPSLPGTGTTVVPRPAAVRCAPKTPLPVPPLRSFSASLAKRAVRSDRGAHPRTVGS